MSIYKSGAFIQQCFSVHARCLTLQKCTPPDLVLFTCTSCRMAHRLTLRAMTTRVPVRLAVKGAAPTDEPAMEYLAQCLSAHAIALMVREMDVVNDWVGLRCAECRRLFDFDVAVFETQQR